MDLKLTPHVKFSNVRRKLRGIKLDSDIYLRQWRYYVVHSTGPVDRTKVANVKVKSRQRNRMRTRKRM